MKPLRIALTKGRLEKDTIGLLEKIGYDCSAVRNKGRKLILPVGDNEFEVVLAKAADVITYVEHGVCDLGVVGKDTILENGTRFYEILDEMKDHQRSWFFRTDLLPVPDTPVCSFPLLQFLSTLYSSHNDLSCPESAHRYSNRQNIRFVSCYHLLFSYLIF